MKSTLLLILVLVVVCLNSCATLFNSSPAEVSFNSKPKGMPIVINNSLFVKSPLLEELSENNKLAINSNYSINNANKLIDIAYNQDKEPENIKNSNRNNPNDFENNEIFNRKASAIWNFELKDGDEFKDVKIYGIVNDSLVISFRNRSEFVEKDSKGLKTSDTKLQKVAIDSIISFSNKGLVESGRSIGNFLIGVIAGAVVGLGIGKIVDPSQQSDKGLGAMSLLKAGAILGGLVGILTPTKKDLYYYIGSYDKSKKIKFIKENILIQEY